MQLNFITKLRLILGLIAASFIAILILVLILALRSKSTSSIYVNTSQTAVVKQLQSLNRFETASFTIEKIIDAGTSGNAFSEFLFGDRILLIAHGQVIAGFDFKTLKAENISVDRNKVTLNLVSPQILVTRLDNDQTRVYDRKQGILSHGDKDLEAKARAAAEASIQKAACEEHILDEAAKNARAQLTALLKSLGFETVIINIPQSSC